LGQRGVAFLLALAVELLVALLLWFIAPILPDEKPLPTTTTFGIQAPGETEQPARTEREQKAAKRRGSDKARDPTAKPIETPPPPTPPTEPLPQTFIRMSRAEYRAADIAGKGTTPRPSERDPAVATASESQPGDSPVVRRGPNGEPVYGVGWYRRGPTQAEVGPYISHRALGRPGKGVILCRMVADHRVEDCQEVAESPRGSGYAGTVRQAAWQFRVRPPRVGGRETIGKLVEITLRFGNDKEDTGE
jgi:hypothetical protein